MRSEYPVRLMGRTPAYTPGARASTATNAGEPRQEALEAGGILLIERGRFRGIDVEDGDERPLRVEHRNDDLGSCARIAGDVTGKASDVGYDEASPLLGGDAADTTTECDIQTAERPLIRPDAQQIGLHDAIEPCPQMSKRVVDE